MNGLKLRFLYHCLRRDVSNFSLLKHRDYTGFLITMHQSGTHWLKHMLATAIARTYNLSPPRYSSANEIIGGIRDPFDHPGVPHVVCTHSIPHLLVGVPAVRRWIRFPRYVVLVRDIRATLVANYEKWKARYDCGFSEFLRGDVSGLRFNSDIWWCLRFCNAWGAIAARFPDETLVMKYEDLRRNALGGLGQINAFWALGLTRDSLIEGVAESTKEKMARKRDPVASDLAVVREDARDLSEWFAPQDAAFVHETCGRFLTHRFGYDYDA
ncbi:MAG: sulfotransferase domain-containing protein [Gammaproteobacteria bacterium]|nr:sulfotransferase domain-containing protein [Gammaproteobacteria bacterium]